MKLFFQRLLKNETFFAILLISLTTIVTHGLFLSKLGYYYDDWYVLWSGAARGAASLISLFSTDRPFMGVVYSVLYQLMGDSRMAWQLYALLWRLLGGLAFFWILRLVWPKQKLITTVMAVLFIIYPGFLSQPDANTKQNHLYGFGTALLSIAFMLQSLKTNHKLQKLAYMLFSVLLTANYLWIYEYMLGLEAMRLVLLGLTLFQSGFSQLRSLVKETLKKWWPYPIVIAVFLYWRIFIFDSTRSATNADNLVLNYRSDLLNNLLRVFFQTLKDFFTTTVFAWYQQGYQLAYRASYTDLVFGFLVGALAVALLIGYLALYKKYWEPDSDADDSHLITIFLALGVFITLCAVFPVVLSGRAIDLGDTYKSYALHPLPGVILILAGFILMLKPDFRKVVLIVVIWMAVSTHTLNILSWARNWQAEQQTWWQLSWRAPDIKNNTLVAAYMQDEFAFQQDYETWGPINLIYRPGQAKFPLIQSEVLNTDTSHDILAGTVRDRYVRDIWLHRDFTKLLLISVPTSTSCAHVIDGTLPVYSESERLLVKEVGRYSRIGRIIPDGTAPTPPVRIFGTEPAHTWCYYYQKASLARQMGQWDQIGQLYDQVTAQKLTPGDNSEIFPFVEGLANQGRLADASQLYKQYIQPAKSLNFALCATLTTDPGYPPEFKYDYKTIQQLLCSKK